MYMNILQKIYSMIFIQNPLYKCPCYECSENRIRERGFIRYIHCYHCETYFYSLYGMLSYLAHFETNNCLYPIFKRN